MSPLSPTADDDYKEESIPKTSEDDELSETVDLYDQDVVDPVYRAKAHLLSKTMREIGMGRYQARKPPGLYLTFL